MPDASARVILGGRPYVAVQEITFEHQIWMATLVRRARLDDFAELIASGPGEEELAQAIAGRVIDAGVTLDLLATVLVPEGERWTPQVAERTRSVFAALTDAREHALLQGALAGLLFGFFDHGRALSTISRNSSSPARPATSAAIVGASTAAAGARSSASSPDGIPIASP